MNQVGLQLSGTVPASMSAGLPVDKVAPAAAPDKFQSAMQFANLRQQETVRPTAHVQQPIRVAQVFGQPPAAQPVPQPVQPAAAQPSAPTALDATRPNNPAGPVNPARPVDAADAQDRARRTLELSQPEAPSATTSNESEGDRILDGLMRLRGVFDAEQGKLVTAMNAPITDANSMIGLQMEVVNFSMLVDVSSKLTGKSTSALETLMKGQ